MIYSNNWLPHESSNTDPNSKPIVAGSGPFTNELGQADLSGNVLIRSWRTSANAKYFLIFFILIWDTLIVFMFKSALNGPVTVNHTHYASMKEAVNRDPTAYVFLMFPIAGFIMTYMTIAFWINKTVVRVDLNNNLNVERGPLPWPLLKPVFINKSEIKKFFVQMYCAYRQNNMPVSAYRVIAQNNEGKEMIIERGLKSYDDARILEQWLEKKLSIQAVEG